MHGYPILKLLLRILPAALVVAMAIFAAPAQANSNLQSFVMDDDLLVYGTYQQRDSAMSTMRAMGVDGVRVSRATPLGELIADPARNFVVIMKDGKVYKNTLAR